MRILLASALCLLALGAPAQAETIERGCAFYAATAGLGADERAYTGVVYGYAVLSTPGVPVTITCETSFDGVARHRESFSGTTVAAGAAPMAYSAREGETGQFCALVDIGSDGFVDETWCDGHSWYESRDAYLCVTSVPLPDPGQRSHDEDALCRFAREVLDSLLP